MTKVPATLKTWFTIHFVLDVIFATPLMIIPEKTIQLLGWSFFDPLTTRLVAAALFAIGIESLLSRNSSVDTFKKLLDLKIIWSFAAILAITLSLPDITPLPIWGILLTFILFNINWIYWRVKISQ